MSEPLVLTIPGDAAELSPNRRRCWRAERRLERAWQWRAWTAWRANGYPRYERVRVSFVIRRGRALDGDNACGSRALKAIVDGLKDRRAVRGRPRPVLERRMIEDDDPVHVERGEVRQETGREWRTRPEVVVTVEALP